MITRKTSSPSRVVLYFIILFFGMFLITSVLFYVMLLKDNERKIESMKLRARHNVIMQRTILLNSISTVETDLLFLSTLNEIVYPKKIYGSAQLEFIEKEFFEFMTVKKMYDQLRYLDADGNEIVRVNYGTKRPILVPQEDLQNKSSRYYFSKTIALGEKQLYISPFDLNIEYGKIEIPYKPVIRFATPIYKKDHSLKGIIILNYLGANIIDSFKQATDIYEGIFSLINSDGYFLYTAHPDNEWNFMFDDKKNNRLENTDPLLWKEIQSKGSFQTIIDGILYTVETVELFPKTEKQLSSLIIMNSIFVDDTHAGRTLFKNILFGGLVVITIFCFAFALAISFAIEQRRKYHFELEYSARYDALTNLPNRSLFLERLKQCMQQVSPANLKYAVFFTDLDGFKQVNDQLGHKVGDLVLQKVAERLENCVRLSDTVSRFGGDEFVILLTNIHTAANAGIVAKKIITAVSEQMQINGHSITLGISVGIMVSDTTDNHSADVLLKKADTAMYEVKKSGKNNYQFFT